MKKYINAGFSTPTSKDGENIVMCQVYDCTSFYPGQGKPNKHARADVRYTDDNGNRIELCCYHYDRLLYRMGLGRLSEVTGREVDMTLDMVHAHWRKVDAQETEVLRKRPILIERLKTNPVKPFSEVEL